MKKSLLAVVATTIIATFMLTVCSDGDNGNGAPNVLVGTWSGRVIVELSETPSDFPVTLTFTNTQAEINGSNTIPGASSLIPDPLVIHIRCGYTRTDTTITPTDCTETILLGDASVATDPVYSVVGNTLTLDENILTFQNPLFKSVEVIFGGDEDEQTFVRQ